MSWTEDLTTGLAEHIAAAGIAVWNPGGAYADTETEPCLFYRAVPPAPDRIITLAEYDSDSDAEQADVAVYVQTRIRGDQDPRSHDRIADDLYDLLHGAERLTLAGVRVVQIARQSSAQLGPDGNGRWARTDNYRIDAMRPTAHQPF